MTDLRTLLADEAARHRLTIGIDMRLVLCICGWSDRDEANESMPVAKWRLHVADELLALEPLARARQEAAASALRDAAKDWRWSAWSDAPRAADRAAERIGTANYVGDWLAARAPSLTPTVTPSTGEEQQ